MGRIWEELGEGKQNIFYEKYIFNKRKYINVCMGDMSIESQSPSALGERGGRGKAVGER